MRRSILICIAASLITSAPSPPLHARAGISDIAHTQEVWIIEPYVLTWDEGYPKHSCLYRDDSGKTVEGIEPRRHAHDETVVSSVRHIASINGRYIIGDTYDDVYFLVDTHDHSVVRRETRNAWETELLSRGLLSDTRMLTPAEAAREYAPIEPPDDVDFFGVPESVILAIFLAFAASLSLLGIALFLAATRRMK